MAKERSSVAELATLNADLVGALARQTGSDGTLYDPDQGTATPADHYAQISTALALYLHDPTDRRTRKALEAWLALPLDQYGHQPFNRFLLLLLEQAARENHAGIIDPPLLATALSRCPISRRYPSNNWTLLAQLCRLIEATSKRERQRAARTLSDMLSRWTTAAGGFIDFPSHPATNRLATPVTYHHKALLVATVATLYTDLPELLDHVRRMLKWVCLAWDDHSHVGGFGRSTHALFGDACLLATLLLLGFDETDTSSTGSKIISGIVTRWSTQTREEGLIALNPAGDHQGWDHYMFLSVYNAWAAAITGWAMHRAGPARLAAETVDTCLADTDLIRDDDAGLLRFKTGTGFTGLVSTHGQIPQMFGRDEIELRYAGGVPFHVIHSGRILCPASSRVRVVDLLENPALAGWTPVFLIDGMLFGLVEFDTARVEKTTAMLRIILEGSPISLQRMPPSTIWQGLKAALDWRLLNGALGRQEVFHRARAKQIQARLVITLDHDQTALSHELTVNPVLSQTVRYLNPGGHAVVAGTVPITRELYTGKGRRDPAVNIEPEPDQWHAARLDSAIRDATGYCLGERLIGSEGYSHRLVLNW